MLVASLREVQVQLQQQQGEMTQLRTHNAQLEERLMSTLAATEANIDPMPGTTAASHPGTQVPPHLTQGGVPQGGLSSDAPDRGLAASGYSGRYSIKINEPKEFRGGPKTDVREWVKDVKDYIGFHTLRGPPLGENEKVLIAATWLAGDAKIRWTAERQKPEKIQAADPMHRALNFTLEGFLEWIQREFKDINREEKDRSAYVRCVQGTRTVAQYVTDLLSKAARVVPPPSSLDQRDRFKDGLSPLMRKEMARVRPTPIDAREYMSIAEELDQTIRSVERSERYAGSDPHGRSGNPPGERSSGFSRKYSGDPERINNLESAYLDESDQEDALTEAASVESDDDIDEQLAAISLDTLKCYQCKKMGHIARDCPTRAPKHRKRSGKEGVRFDPKHNPPENDPDIRIPVGRRDRRIHGGRRNR